MWCGTEDPEHPLPFINTVFTSLQLLHVSKQCLGICHVTFGCLRCCLETTWLKIIFFKLIVSLQFCTFYTLGFFFFLQLGFLSFHILTVNISACNIFSPFFSFSCFYFHLILLSSLLVPLHSISSKYLHLYFGFSPLADVTSADHYYFRIRIITITTAIVFLVCSSVLLLASSCPAQPAGVFKCSSVGTGLNIPVT